MNLVRHELGLSEKAERFPLKATCLAIYSRAVNAGEPLEAALAKQFPWCAEWKDELRNLFAAYVEAKQKQGVLDYDDLLLYWGELMRVPELAADVGARFDHVLVDEYQDTNALQASILRGLKPDGAGLTVVGDDAQAIYGFRAATVRNILDFPDQFQPPAEIVRLEQNYRSTQPILAACNAVIGLAREQFTKNLRSQQGLGRAPGAGFGRRRHRPGRPRGRDRAGEPRGRHGAQGAGGAVPHLAPQRHARDRAQPPQYPLRQVRRAEIHRGGPHQGHAGGAALGREHGRPGHRLPRRSAAAGPRARDRGQGPRRHGRAFPHRCARHLPSARQGGRALARVGRGDAAAAWRCRRMAGRARPCAAVVSAPSRAALPRRARSRRRSRPAAAHRQRLCLARVDS